MINPDILDGIERRFKDITQEMFDPAIATDPRKMASLGREHTSLRAIVSLITDYRSRVSEMIDLKEMIRNEHDPDLLEMAQMELVELESSFPKQEDQLRLKLIPKDPEDTKDAIVEIRAGTGGDEAALFAGDLYRLYLKVAEIKEWKVDLLVSRWGPKEVSRKSYSVLAARKRLAL